MPGFVVGAERTKIRSEPHYARAAEADGLVFFSGQLSLDREGHIVGRTIEKLTRTVLANLAAILAEKGLSPRAVVKVTVWLKNANEFKAFNEVYAEFFGTHRPARSTVVAGLVSADALIELEAIANSRG